MKFSRKVKRDQLRKQVGNKNMQSVWNRDRVIVLLEEEKVLQRRKKVAIKDEKRGTFNAVYTVSGINMLLRQNHSELTRRGWSFKYNKLMA